jgi:hypothetical protein
VKEATEIKKALETILRIDKDMESERLHMLLNAQTQLALKLGIEHQPLCDTVSLNILSS